MLGGKLFSKRAGISYALRVFGWAWKTRTHSRTCDGCHVSTFSSRDVTKYASIYYLSLHIFIATCELKLLRIEESTRPARYYSDNSFVLSTSSFRCSTTNSTLAGWSHCLFLEGVDRFRGELEEEVGTSTLPLNVTQILVLEPFLLQKFTNEL